ncbi:hypothetical protein [Nonomuraea sp. NPDC001023]|uniref:hypothetical protein n=1 Tax=unclassified Nonomuraea TaxID=2593643 RepID=UPI00332BDA15
MLAKAILLTAAIGLSGVVATPAGATAARSPESICGSGFWIVKGGTQPVKTSSGRRYGTVYLLYSRSSGENCVVTVKSSFVGTKTPMSAMLTVQPKGKKVVERVDSGKFAYYAGPVKYYAANACVKFWGSIKPNGHDPAVAGGGRQTWGNCT